MLLSHAIYLFLAGAVAGALNAVAGGGSFISFPSLVFVGVPAVQANATNTVGLWPGLAASSVAYFRRLDVPGRLLAAIVTSSLAGGLAGALLLIHTPQRTFEHLIPWLLLIATTLFVFGNRIRAMAGQSAQEDVRQMSGLAIGILSLANLVIAVYGGYFGAGLGLLALAMLAGAGMHEIHSMNALRTVQGTLVNAAAVVTFIVARAVYWPQCVAVLAGAICGGWFGARLAQRTDPAKVRRLVIAVGVAMTVYFFLRLR